MFTGIVEEMGRLAGRQGSRFEFEARAVLEDVSVGDSISVSGVCLTVEDFDGDRWYANLVDETLQRSNLGELQVGDGVNLERSVRVEDRLGGHIVQGHVDCTGKVISPAPDLRVQIPERFAKYVVEKGSICVDGVSLTVVDAYDDGFSVAIIPHTMAVTTIGGRKVGATVNVEVDALARYAEQIIRYANGENTGRGSVAG